jgi:hypothetical protein
MSLRDRMEKMIKEEGLKKTASAESINSDLVLFSQMITDAKAFADEIFEKESVSGANGDKGSNYDFVKSFKNNVQPILTSVQDEVNKLSSIIE